MHSFLRNIFLSALVKNKPEAQLEAFFKEHPSKKPEKKTPVYVMAAGKAAVPMAAWLAEHFSVSKECIRAIAPDSEKESAPYLIKASHPIPGDKSILACTQLIEFAKRIPAGATVFIAISGGTSSLVCQPVKGISLADIQQLHRGLINSGATIQEINCVRKHLSQIKGGQLLRHFHPDIQLIDLVISDVPNDDLSIIGSGLTIADPTTYNDAITIVKKYNLWNKVAKGVRNHLEEGAGGRKEETLKPGEDPIDNHHSFIIGSASKFARTLARGVGEKGFKPIVANGPYTESVKEVAEHIYQHVLEQKESETPLALIFYGESTVNVTGSGKGGRNQELALRGAMKISGMDNVSWLSAGTDGIDGPTDAAGAIVDGAIINQAKKKGVNPEEYLKNNDSYHFHQQMETLLITGPTGNNMMDVTVVLLGG